LIRWGSGDIGMSIRVLANHAHVFPASMNPGGTIEQLLRVLDACGIDQAVCFAPLPYQCDGKDLPDPSAWLAGELKAHSDRLFGFGTVDTRRAEVVAQVKHIQELGLRGIKMHPNAQDFDILSPRLFEVYTTAQELNLFITFHTGVHESRLEMMRLLRFDEIAWNFPSLKFSMEHVGGYHFFNEALAVIFNHVPPPWAPDKKCNVFAGLTSVFTTHQNRFWHLSDDRIRELAAQVGAQQLIFGLDFPYNRERETKIGLETIRKLFDERDQQLILGGNLRRELGLA
jgi:predicted TIM-barrel fold metal-dependent hydrolase